MHDDGAAISVMSLIIILMGICLSFKTWDSTIKAGGNIQIENAVYQCTKTQELILK